VTPTHQVFGGTRQESQEKKNMLENGMTGPMSIPLPHGVFMLCKHTYKYTRKIFVGFVLQNK
jgi:hypothetical protein